VERTLAESAEHPAVRDAHAEMARQYELEIERKSGGQIVFPWHGPESVLETALEQRISVPNP
jgi:hypothetical protein